MGENLWVAVGEWVCQRRRWRFVSLMRIGKFWGKKKKLMRMSKVVKREKIIIF